MDVGTSRKTIKPSELLERLGHDPNLVLLDVRETGEWRRGHLEGAIHIPLNEVPLRLAELPSALAIVCYCHTGQRSARAQEFLCRHHFPQVYNLEGGIVAWGQTPGARIVTE